MKKQDYELQIMKKAFKSYVKEGNLSEMKKIVESGIDVSDILDNTLAFSTTFRNAEIVKYLVELGANISYFDYSPLYNVVRLEKLEELAFFYETFISNPKHAEKIIIIIREYGSETVNKWLDSVRLYEKLNSKVQEKKENEKVKIKL